MKDSVVLRILVIIFLLMCSSVAFCQTPKQIVLYNSPFKIDTGYINHKELGEYNIYRGTIYYYKMFRVVITDKDSVIVKAGRNGRSIFISEGDRKDVLKKLKR